MTWDIELDDMKNPISKNEIEAVKNFFKFSNEDMLNIKNGKSELTLSQLVSLVNEDRKRMGIK